MFNFIKKNLTKIYEQFTSKLQSLFNKETLDQATLHELETLLIKADIGYKATKEIIAHLEKQHHQGTITKGADLKQALSAYLLSMLNSTSHQDSAVYLMVGINGGGKTTFASKLAHSWAAQGKKVLMAAADTFRAAATNQLAVWAESANCDILIGTEGQDPASVVFQACQKYLDEKYDILIIDTAGRLQTKINLMKELAKIRSIISKKLPEKTINTLLVIDAMLGQNSLEQARIFNQATQVDGLVLTKMDGTGKGGIVCAISQELNLPIFFISYGEKPIDYAPFNGKEFVEKILEIKG